MEHSNTQASPTHWKTGEALEESKQEIKTQLDDTVQQGKNYIMERRQEFANQLSEVSHGLRDAANGLDADANLAAKPLQSFADALDKVAFEVQTRSVSEAVEQTKAFARQRPLFALGGCVLAGLALSHVLKAGVTAASETGGPKPSDSLDGSGSRVSETAVHQPL